MIAVKVSRLFCDPLARAKNLVLMTAVNIGCFVAEGTWLGMICMGDFFYD